VLIASVQENSISGNNNNKLITKETAPNERDDGRIGRAGLWAQRHKLAGLSAKGPQQRCMGRPAGQDNN